MEAEDALGLFDDPTRLGTLACEQRAALDGPRIWIRPVDSIEIPAVAARASEGAATAELLPTWPRPQDIVDGDRIIVQVDPTPEARCAFTRWLSDAADAAVRWSVAPCSRAATGTHRLWCIGAARLLLPRNARVEARHDLIGIRLAQIALGFGADTFSGPLQPDRKLPLAGVPRPTETTLAGLRTLVRQAGLEPTEAETTSRATA